MFTKPSIGHLEWVPSADITRIVEPADAKKLIGWSPQEPLPAQNENWINHLFDQWTQYFDKMTNALGSGYVAVLGSGAEVTAGLATHSTPQSAYDAAHTAGGGILKVLEGSHTGNLTMSSTTGVIFQGVGMQSVITGNLSITGNKNAFKAINLVGTVSISGTDNFISGWVNGTKYIYPVGMLQGFLVETGSNVTLSEIYNGAVIMADTTGGSFNITSHANPSVGFKFTVKDALNNFGVSGVTFVRNGSQNIEFLPSNYTMNSEGAGYTFLFDGTDWFITAATGLGSGVASARASEFGDIFQQMRNAKDEVIDVRLPNQILETFENDARGVVVDAIVSSGGISVDSGETSGTYTRKLRGSNAAGFVSGSAIHRPQALAPKNGQTVPMTGTSETIIFAGDVSEFFTVSKNIIIKTLFDDSDAYSDGYNRASFLTDGDQVVELEVTAVSYNSGTDETTVTISNGNALDLSMGLGTNDLNESLRIIPWDYQHKVKTLSTEALEKMTIKDAFLDDVIGISGENFLRELFSITGSIRLKSAQKSPSGQYYIIKLGEWNGTDITWHFGYSVDYGATWTAFGTTINNGNAVPEEQSGGFYLSCPDSIAVDDQGNAFWTYNFYSTTNRVYGVYSDLTAGTPTLNNTAGTGSDALAAATNGAGIIASLGADDTWGVAVKVLDGYVAVAVSLSVGTTLRVRWYSGGGATHVGLSSTTYTHNGIAYPCGLHIEGTAPNRRTHLFRRNNTDGYLSHVYFDEGSLTAVANNAIASTNIAFAGSSVLNNRAVIYHYDTNEIPKLIQGTVNGTPSFGTATDVFAGTSTLIVDMFTGWNTASELNLYKVKAANIAQNPSNENHVLVAMDLAHNDSRTRGTLLEFPNISTTNFTGISNFTVATTTSLRSAGSGERKGQTFVASGSTPFARTASFLCYQAGQIGSGYVLRAEIFATSGSLPTGSALATSQDIDPSKITKDTSGQWIHFNFPSLALSNAVEYAVVLTATYPISASNNIVFRVSSSSAISGTAITYNGSAWAADASNDHGFMLSDFWITHLGLTQNNLVYDIGNYAFHDQETQIVNIDSNSAAFTFRRTNHDSGAFRELSGHVYRRVITYGNGTNQSTHSDIKVAGYAETNHDRHLVFSTACGTTDCARQNIATGALDADLRGEDRSGTNVYAPNYTNISAADIVSDSDFQSGVCYDFNGSNEKIGYVDRAQFDLYFDKPFIIEVEIKAASISGAHDILSQYSTSASYGWNFGIDSSSGDFRMLVANSSGTTLASTITSTGFITSGNYFKVRAVYDGLGGQIRIFKATTVNGAFTEATYTTNTSFASGNTSSSAALFVGGREDNAAYFNGRIGYVKFSNGIDSFVYDGFKNQPPIVGHINLGRRIVAENKVGTNQTTSGSHFDNNLLIGPTDNAAIVDSYDVILNLEKPIEGDTGTELEYQLALGKASDRDVSSVRASNIRFSK